MHGVSSDRSDWWRGSQSRRPPLADTFPEEDGPVSRRFSNAGRLEAGVVPRLKATRNKADPIKNFLPELLGTGPVASTGAAVARGRRLSGSEMRWPKINTPSKNPNQRILRENFILTQEKKRILGRSQYANYKINSRDGRCGVVASAGQVGHEVRRFAAPVREGQSERGFVEFALSSRGYLVNVDTLQETFYKYDPVDDEIIFSPPSSRHLYKFCEGDDVALFLNSTLRESEELSDKSTLKLNLNKFEKVHISDNFLGSVYRYKINDDYYLNKCSKALRLLSEPKGYVYAFYDNIGKPLLKNAGIVDAAIINGFEGSVSQKAASHHGRKYFENGNSFTYFFNYCNGEKDCVTVDQLNFGILNRKDSPSKVNLLREIETFDSNVYIKRNITFGSSQFLEILLNYDGRKDKAVLSPDIKSIRLIKEVDDYSSYCNSFKETGKTLLYLFAPGGARSATGKIVGGVANVGLQMGLNYGAGIVAQTAFLSSTSASYAPTTFGSGRNASDQFAAFSLTSSALVTSIRVVKDTAILSGHPGVGAAIEAVGVQVVIGTAATALAQSYGVTTGPFQAWFMWAANGVSVASEYVANRSLRGGGTNTRAFAIGAAFKLAYAAGKVLAAGYGATLDERGREAEEGDLSFSQVITGVAYAEAAGFFLSCLRGGVGLLNAQHRRQEDRLMQQFVDVMDEDDRPVSWITRFNAQLRHSGEWFEGKVKNFFWGSDAKSSSVAGAAHERPIELGVVEPARIQSTSERDGRLRLSVIEE